jgi:metal-dependent amidase/aminoacylase/carboxypeptidase family protein
MAHDPGDAFGVLQASWYESETREVDCENRYLHRIAAVYNDGALAAQASSILMKALGDRVTFVPATAPGYTASEDYSEYVEAGVRSVYFGIGGDDPKMLAAYKAQGKPVPVNHSPYFAPVPEPSIRTGVAVLTLAVLMVTANLPI